MWEVLLEVQRVMELTLPEETCVCHRSAIYLTKPGASVRVRSWPPEEKHYHGFLITHDESISISEYFTVPREGDDGTHPMYVTVWWDASHQRSQPPQSCFPTPPLHSLCCTCAQMRALYETPYVAGHCHSPLSGTDPRCTTCTTRVMTR